MKLLQSKKLKLPPVYFISDKKELKDLPIGIPFIYGNEAQESDFVRLLEYEVLYLSALKSGYPFDFLKILKENGYDDLIFFDYGESSFNEGLCENDVLFDDSEEDFDKTLLKSPKDSTSLLNHYLKDSSVYVDIQKLKELHIFPIWFENLESAIQTNIANFITYNPNMYNKKLEGMYGNLVFTPPLKNLIIIDISGSIPRGVSSTCLTLAKNLAATFYADLLITGSKSTLYNYENINDLSLDSIYSENGMDNDQVYFKKLVSDKELKYNTCICFGDNHYPGDTWSNSFNRRTKWIDVEDGKKLCKWEIEHLISFHTGNEKDRISDIAGYAKWFTPKTITHIEDWVTYLKN